MNNPIPPAIEKGTPKNKSPKNSQKKKVKSDLRIKMCPHQVIWGLGKCGICGENERKFK